MQENFVGLKVGDVNGSASFSNSGQGNDSHSANTLIMEFDDQVFEKGEIVELVLRMKNTSQVAGMQFTLESNALELIDMEGIDVDLGESNFAPINENMTAISWSKGKLQEASELIRIRFIAQQNGILSESLAISSAALRSEAYVGNALDIVPIKLTGRNNTEQTFELYQNKPNPFNGSTTVSFDLPQASKATLTITDVTGRVVWKYTDEFDKGTQSIVISERDINATGLLYYTLEAGDFSAVKKMIIIE